VAKEAEEGVVEKPEEIPGNEIDMASPQILFKQRACQSSENNSRDCSMD
jgi:hypothetical protein